MNNIGKVINQLDDSSKAFQQRCLAGHDGRGIDVEGLYFAKKMDVYGNITQPESYQYYILEYLKCESPLSPNKKNPYPPNAPADLYLRDLCPNSFSPWNSDPNKYKWNWRKFYVLYKLYLRLRPAELVFLNYSDGFIQPKTENGIKPERIPAPVGYADQVRLMYVNTIDIDVIMRMSKSSSSDLRQIKDNYITFKEDAFYTFEEYSTWFVKLNESCILPPLYEAQTLFGEPNTTWRF